MRKQQGFTLAELIIVIVILALVGALLMPLFAYAKKEGHKAQCTSNLRQTYAAWALYKGSNDDQAPVILDPLVRSGRLEEVWSCPADTWSPGANAQASARIGRKVSLFYMPGETEMVKKIAAADANHGVFYCVTHGERVRNSGDAESGTTGLVLRCRLDGSVQRAQVGHQCWTSADGSSGIKGRPFWTFLTDAKCPPEICPPGGRPCR